MSEELKPCPFCGGEAEGIETKHDAVIECTNCYASIHTVGLGYKLVEHWNTRAGNCPEKPDSWNSLEKGTWLPPYDTPLILRINGHVQHITWVFDQDDLEQWFEAYHFGIGDVDSVPYDSRVEWRYLIPPEGK